MNAIVSTWTNMFAYAPGSFTYVCFWVAAVVTWFSGSLVLAGRDGLPRTRVALVLLLSAPLFFVGARAHALLFEAQVPFADLVREPSLLLEPGWRLPGGLVLAAAFAPLWAALLRVPFRPFADAVLPFAGLSLAIGRLGCFLNGCCHGRVSDLPWAMRFARDSEAWANHMGRGLIPSTADFSLPVQPLQLYLVLTGVTATAILLWLRPRRRFVGEVALLGGVLISWPPALLELLRETELMQPVGMRSAIPIVFGTLCFVTWLRARFGTASSTVAVPGIVSMRRS